MITLTLLHPLELIPVQSWAFESQSVVRMGRSKHNDATLYSAVVSRHHVELKHNGSVWEVVNLSSNGTYTEGKRISKMPVVDGMVIRLASSGPQVQIRTSTVEPEAISKALSGRRSSSPLEKSQQTSPGESILSTEELEKAQETYIENSTEELFLAKVGDRGGSN